MTKQRTPIHIEDYARRVAAKLNRILDPDRDPRVKDLDLLARFREDLNEYTRADLARTLEAVASRAAAYRGRFSVKPVPPRSVPARRQDASPRRLKENTP